MDLTDLKVLIDEIRNGREEDTATDWKRCWYNFTVQNSRDEFVKDITAMANATTRDPRAIVIGIGPGGVVQNAPLPEDEARLQQRLHAITPTPHIAFKAFTLSEGLMVSVIEVLEPFDKPYVAKLDSRNLIFVRQGSSTTTATRAMLDRWYQQRRNAPELRILVSGNEVKEGSTIDFPRPRHVAQSENNLGLDRILGRRMPYQTDPEQEADNANRSLKVRLSLENRSNSPALHVVVDFNIEPVAKLWLPPGDWATSPSENCYADGVGIADGRGHVRQRIHRINPHTKETLVPMELVCAKGDHSAPIPAQISYRVTDEQGERLSGTFIVHVTFDGEKIVRSEFRPF